MEAEAGEDFSDENLEEKPDKKDLAIADLTDRLKRSMAEFDNFRKRSEKEKATMFDMGARSVAEKLLPIVDNFERAMIATPAEGEGKAFADGIAMIYNQMTKTLEDLGVKPIDCVGKDFDPNLHNAMMHIEDESLSENVVAEEVVVRELAQIHALLFRLPAACGASRGRRNSDECPFFGYISEIFLWYLEFYFKLI